MHNGGMKQPTLIDMGELPSPIFQPRPGWGGKLKRWFHNHGGMHMLQMLILVILVLTSLAMIRRWDQAQLATATPSASPDATQSKYSFIAAYGVGLTHISAQAVDAYTADQKITLTAVEHLYAVDSLARQLGWRDLALGEKVIFSSQRLAETIISAKALTPQQRTAWSRFLR